MYKDLEMFLIKFIYLYVKYNVFIVYEVIMYV